MDIFHVAVSGHGPSFSSCFTKRTMPLTDIFLIMSMPFGMTFIGFAIKAICPLLGNRSKASDWWHADIEKKRVRSHSKLRHSTCLPGGLSPRASVLVSAFLNLRCRKRGLAVVSRVAMWFTVRATAHAAAPHQKNEGNTDCKRYPVLTEPFHNLFLSLVLCRLDVHAAQP